MHPSIHIHLSWTELKSGRGYWRIMADLNPSIPREAEQRQFADALQQAAPKQFADACEQGDRYFFIPALNRHRGVTHFYLENYQSGCFEDDRALASRVGEAAIDTYMDLLSSRAQNAPPLAEEDAQQLAYHTLYFFQVLTLDRGTTSGLLIHNQNDIGILGSLPPQVDKELLRSWIPKMPVPQNELLEQLIDALPGGKDCRVDDAVKQRLADVVRHHYGLYPEALDLQASGTYVPPTVNNHRPDQL